MNTPVRRILFVDKWNVCLSPMAAGLMTKALCNEKLDDVVVESVGILENASGHPACELAVTCMKEHGIDITGHRSRPISEVKLDEYDKIVCLDQSSRVSVRILADKNPSKLMALMVLSPYGQNLERFRRCAQDIKRTTDDLASLIALDYARQ